MIDTIGCVHTSIVSSKTKVAPIKRLTLPRLELCGAHLLANLLFHVKEALNLPLQEVYAWTDSTIVLNWLDGNPRRFKTFVGNRVSRIMELISSKHWRHVPGHQNPADCASRGMLPSELLEHTLWWNGPDWLRKTPEHWPRFSDDMKMIDPSKDSEICLSMIARPINPVIDIT